MSRIRGIGGAVLLVSVVLAFALIGARSRQVSLQDLNIGDCFVLDDDDVRVGVASFQLIGCDEALEEAARGGGVAAYVLKTGRLADIDNQYPNESELLAMVDRECDSFLEVSPAILPLLPDERAWTSAKGPYACLSVSLG